MAVFKNYSFEYNAQRVDIFKSVVVCSNQYETDSFKEGCALEIADANFYGIITECKNSGERYSLDLVAESYGRELRNTSITTEISFFQVDAISLIKDHLLPEGWAFQYPGEFDTNPRYLSYILRNGSYLSHISTILDSLGLDYTIYSVKVGETIEKYISAFYRDNFDGRDVLSVKEWETIGNLSITVDYGKVATSITVMGAESDNGVDQTIMDAEIGNWHTAPRLLSCRDLVTSKSELATDSYYLWYLPASVNDPSVDTLVAGDTIVIDSERMLIDSIWFLPEVHVSSWEDGELEEDDFPFYLENISNYNPTGAIVASIVSASFSATLESVNKLVTIPDGRTMSEYGMENELHGVYDDIFCTSVLVSSSDYLTLTKNLPETNGFVWFGSEFAFYRDAVDSDSNYLLTGLVRGVPTCATASCEHCGSDYARFYNPSYPWYGNTYGCPFGGTDTDLADYCTLAADIKSMFSITSAVTQCPIFFDNESVCPAMKCPLATNETKFTTLCTKNLLKSEIEWTKRYPHHKGSIVFPASYYYDTDETGASEDTYEMYARDSLIGEYGYLPTRVQVKGIADIDGLDKIAEGRLRLSAIPTVGKLLLFDYDPWVVPASAFPGDVIEIEVASHARYDPSVEMWYPTHWFDVSTQDHSSDPDWMIVSASTASEPRYLKIKEKFVIQKTVKPQRGMPEITFGAGDIGFQNLTDYIADTMDVTSQRHRNQERSKIIKSSENGIAAKVKNSKTGEEFWVRMVR